MTLAEIIRAQLATGRPLRVTRALLEALVALEQVEGPVTPEEQALARAYVERRDAQRHAVIMRERDEARAEARAWQVAIAGALDGCDASGCEHFLPRDEMAAAVVAVRAERDVLRRESGEWQDIAAGYRRERDEARAEVERLRSLAAPPDCARLVREAEERGARWALRWVWDTAGAEIDAIRAAPGYRHPYPTDIEHARVTAFGTMRGHTGCTYPSGSKEVAERICAEARKVGSDE